MVIGRAANRPGMKMHSADDPRFALYGVTRGDSGYYRIPLDIASTISKNISEMTKNTTGGRIRFRTDSPYVAVKVKLESPELLTRMSALATHGMDVYCEKDYLGSLIPPLDMVNDEYETLAKFESREMRNITLNLPLYSHIKELLIGLDEDSAILPAPDYGICRPIVYYGSSITNGATSSRPGLTYESIISRMLDADFINLGFGGSARGETAMAEYIASLDMSAFVMDYDHNAPTAKHLAETHEPMFLTVREKHPDLPVIMISRPAFHRNADIDRRFEVIYNTYSAAKARGDNNVYLIDGREFFLTIGNDWSVDGIHPTDLAFRIMAEKIGAVLARIFGKSIIPQTPKCSAN